MLGGSDCNVGRSSEDAVVSTTNGYENVRTCQLRARVVCGDLRSGLLDCSWQKNMREKAYELLAWQSKRCQYENEG